MYRFNGRLYRTTSATRSQTLGERESGTEHLEGAMAAWDECLSVTATAWPPEWVQSVRARRDATQAEIKRRSITERSDF